MDWCATIVFSSYFHVNSSPELANSMPIPISWSWSNKLLLKPILRANYMFAPILRPRHTRLPLKLNFMFNFIMHAGVN